MQVDLRKSGKEAVEAVIFQQYDLIFMDHRMPDMDGVEATQAIRKMGIDNPYYKHLPIIALTANAVTGIREEFLSNGFNDFLSKPIETIKLNVILERWIPKEKRIIVTRDAGSAVVEKDLTASDAITIDGLDVKKGVFLSGGTMDGFLETLAIFCKDGYEKIDDINACLKSGNLKLYTVHVHALKSASANVGAAALSESAEALEMAGEREDLAYIRSHTPAFISSLELILRRIFDALAVHKEKNGGENAFQNTDLLIRELVILKEALENLDAGAMNESIEILQKMKQKDNFGSVIDDISGKILVAEYDEAVESVKSLLKELKNEAPKSA
jgi:CheY-like chemotaxis protein